ncbi:MAG: hypothetical protein ACRDOL_14665, partial [Streptosporangiaceae bacterium]
MTSPQHPAATRPPRHDIGHVGHVELLTGEPEASLRFFVDVLGLTENGREGNSVYLRAWDDYEHHTVKLTAHDTPPVGLPAEEPGYRPKSRVTGRRAGLQAEEPGYRPKS